METPELKSIVEALIFAADEPLSEDRIRETLELENGFDFGALIEELNREYRDGGRAFAIRQVAGGYQIVTQQQFANWIKKLYLGRQKTRLSHAALETLALIAFKQPISRVDIAQIRGVNSDGVIGTLLERKLVTISGRSEAVGRPLLYSTTPEFLKYFGINDIADLPKPREIEELFSKEGMPEELLQALSQTDAQLSLPINAEGEAPAPAEERESKVVENIEPAPPLLPEPEILPAGDTSIPATEIVPPEPLAAAVEVPPDAPEMVTTDAPPVAASETPAIDINEEVVSKLETPGDTETLPAALAPEPANEIAWISLNNEPTNEAEHLASTELAVDELAEAASDLPTFASVTEVVANTSTATVASNAASVEEASVAQPAEIETMMETIAADFARTDAVMDDHENSAQDSFVAEVEEMIAQVEASPGGELQVIEVNDATWPDVEPAEREIDSQDEIDGWVAEEFSREEIAEPDFVQKSADFFLEDVRPPMEAAPPAAVHEENVVPLASEPIVVTPPALASLTDEIFQHLDEPPEKITIVDFAEPTIIEAGAEAAPQSFDHVEVPGAVEEISLPAAPEIIPAASVQELVAAELMVQSPKSALERAAADETKADAIILPAVDLKHEARQPEVAEMPGSIIASAAARETETSIFSDEAQMVTPVAAVSPDIAMMPSESVSMPAVAIPAPAEVSMASAETRTSDEMPPVTLRARVVGWFKRALSKLMALIGTNEK